MSNDSPTCPHCHPHKWHGLPCTSVRIDLGQLAKPCPCPTAWKEPTP